MKKVLVIALMLGAGLAYASSLGVPWFVDNAATGSTPPAAGGVVGLIFRHSNAPDVLTVTIEYFTDTGLSVGPAAPDNSFEINPGASVAFRPVQTDANVEGATYLLIPNRPTTTLPPSNSNNDGKKNGSCVLSWLGPDNYLQGTYKMAQCSPHAVSATDPTVIWMLSGYGHLLPTGISE